MIKDKKFIHQLLWLLAGILPWGFGGFLVHTAQSMAVGTLAYWGMGLLVPFLFFLFQKKGYGSEWGALRAAAHLPLWISFIILQMVIFWSYLPMADKAFKESPIPISISIAFFAVLTFFAVSAIVLDYVLPALYEKLAEKGGRWKVWLGAAYFSGLIPGFAILSFLGLYYANGMRLDPFTASFFLLEVFSFVFYGKIILGMMTFGIYLFLALSGTKGRRITACAFSGIFWLMLLYIPMVISLHLPQAGWQSYMDPSYLPMLPFVSDLWLAGIAIWGGEKVTEWIFEK